MSTCEAASALIGHSLSSRREQRGDACPSPLLASLGPHRLGPKGREEWAGSLDPRLLPGVPV